MRLLLKSIGDELEASINEMVTPVAIAATGAIKELADDWKKFARANIAASGMSAKWQNTLRVNVYPKSGRPSINAAAFLYHRIPYAIVFEEGATIKGNPYMWLPLDTAPLKVGRGKATPKNVASKGVKLFVIPGASGRAPILAAAIKTSRAKRAKIRSRSTGRFTTAALSRGAKPQTKGLPTSVPLFVGINSVTVKKRWQLARVAAAQAARLPAIYTRHSQVVGGR